MSKNINAFKIVENDVFNAFINKIISNNNSDDYCYLDFLGNNHIVNHFNIIDCNNIELSISNEDGLIHKLNLINSKISFDLVIQKQNKYFMDYKNWFMKKYKCSQADVNYRIIKNNINYYGITICDMIKFYKFLNPNNTNETHPELNNFIKKALKIESNLQPKNILGNFYYYGIELWSDQLKLATDSSLENFLSKKIYFQQSDIISLIQISTLKNNKQTKTIKTTSVIKLIKNKINYENIFKLFRYYYFKEDPNIKIEDNLYIFKEPKSIPDVLKQLYEEHKEECYIKYYHLLSKPNNHESQLLNDKYPKIIFKNLQKLESEFPFFALKNVYVKEFNLTSNYYLNHLLDNDMEIIDDLYDHYMLTNKVNKLKYKKNKSDKVIPVDIRYNYYHGSNYDMKPLSKTRNSKKLLEFEKYELFNYDY
jgi:hypothetical protein